MDYKPILQKLCYWRNYSGSGDKYRQEHDLDCILTNGNLFADTLFSLWLPLRYTLDFFNSSRWAYWRNFEYKYLKSKCITLKNYNPFIIELESNIEEFLPQHELTKKLIHLFAIGQERCNVIILLHRQWNTARGGYPYYDYLPHFLHDIFDVYNYEVVLHWIKREKLYGFFYDEIIDKEHIADLAGTGDVCRHSPRELSITTLLDNYVRLLEQRKIALCSVT